MDINARLEKLERENRRIKKLGIVAAAFASVLFISGQAKTNKVVEANEFRLVDASGKVRARLAMLTLLENAVLQKDIPNLSFYDVEGHSRIFIAAFEHQSRIYLNGSQQTVSSEMWAGSPGAVGAGVNINGPSGYFLVSLDGTVIAGPQLEIADKEGYSTQIGKTDLVATKTGKKERTPAASLVLFDKDKKVLWSAP